MINILKIKLSVRIRLGLINKFNLRSFTDDKKPDNIATELPKGFSSPGISRIGTHEENIIGKSQKFKMKFQSKKHKEARIQLLKQEITSNPEFFNAFPHLREQIKYNDVDNTEDVPTFINNNYKIDETEGQPDVVKKRENYFESLLNNQYKGYESVFKTEDEKNIEVKRNFTDGYSDPKGPLKFMSREEKDKIHQEINIKMQELEDSGLSREEILFNRPEGFPLKQDKFFQFIKSNKIAREMLIKPNESFNSDSVIEKALKQDIGPDSSNALLKRKSFKLEEELPINYSLNKYSELYNSKRPDVMIKNDDYNYKENYTNKLKAHLNSERKRPVSFVNPPMTKGQLRRKFLITTIKPTDIHWKNLPLLTRFLNEGGKLMNRYQTRLPGHIHKKLARTVKHARNMGLLPFIDFIKPYHRLPFTSLYNEFVEATSKVVDVKTGLIKIIHQPSTQDKFNYSSYDSAALADADRLEKENAEKFKNTLTLDHAEIPFIPNQDQKDLLVAQNYLLKLSRGGGRDTGISGMSSLYDEQEKQVYHRVYNQFSEYVSPAQFIDSFISEKSYDLKTIKSTINKDVYSKYTFNIPKHLVRKEIGDTINKISSVIKENKLNELKAVDYEKEYEKYQNYKIEPDISKNQLKKRKNVTFKKYKV